MKFSAEELAGYRPGRRDGSLIVIHGNEADLGMHCRLDHPVTLGRDLEAELPLRDIGISRRHALVERDALGRYVVSDLGSTNGTRLNGQPVSEPAPLNEGDKLALDKDKVTLTVNNPDAGIDFLVQANNVTMGQIYSAVLAKERHGLRGKPVYAPDCGLKGARGIFALAANSPGLDAGVLIRNFNDGFAGSGPDIGAHEAGSPWRFWTGDPGFRETRSCRRFRGTSSARVPRSMPWRMLCASPRRG